MGSNPHVLSNDPREPPREKRTAYLTAPVWTTAAVCWARRDAPTRAWSSEHRIQFAAQISSLGVLYLVSTGPEVGGARSVA